MMAFTNASNLMSAILHATYRQLPTGGVIIPIAMFTINTIPTIYGFTPTLVSTGRRIGVRSAIAADELRKQPAIRTTILNRNSRTY